jgi:hypothetical protein
MPDAGRRSPLARKVDALTFKVGTILLLAAGVGVSADAYTERANAFWTSDLMVASGGLLLVSMGCLTKALWASSFGASRFPDVTVEVKDARSRTEPNGATFQELHVLFTNNRPLKKVVLIARYCVTTNAEIHDGRLGPEHFASDPVLVPHWSSDRATPMPLQIPALQSQLAILDFGLSENWASRVAYPIDTLIEIEDCSSSRRVRIPCPAEKASPFQLDELPLVHRERENEWRPTR